MTLPPVPIQFKIILLRRVGISHESLRDKAQEMTGPIAYEVAADELIENEDLQVPGETDPADRSEDSDRDDSDLPVRLLKDFVIYDIATLEVVPVASLVQIQYSGSDYSGSGIVEAWTEEESDDDDDEEEEEEEENSPDFCVKLSKILEFSVHHFSKRSCGLDR
jgi:DNA (cytosine-5)-methyltransferase 1